MSEKAVGALSHWLFEHRSQPVVIDWYDSSWRRDVCQKGRTALDLVAMMTGSSLRRADNPAKRICVQPSAQAARRWNSVRQSVAAATNPAVSTAQLHAVLNPVFFGRWTVVDVNTAETKIHLVARGPGYPGIGPTFNVTDMRAEFELISDEDYRAWFTENFIAVAKTGVAQFDDIDAYVNWSRYGDLRTRYWRILVPVWTKGPTTRLLSAAGTDSGIDLRPKFLDKAGNLDH